MIILHGVALLLSTAVEENTATCVFELSGLGVRQAEPNPMAPHGLGIPKVQHGEARHQRAES